MSDDAKWIAKLVAGIFGIVVLVVWIGLSVTAHNKRACEARGGEYVRLSRGSLCVAPGTMR